MADEAYSVSLTLAISHPMQTRYARALHLHCSEWSECSLARESTMGIGTAGQRERVGRRVEGEQRSPFAINTFHVQLQSHSPRFVLIPSLPVRTALIGVHTPQIV